MKKTALSSFLIVLSILAVAQVPESFNYQVVVRDGASNDPLVNQDVSFRMSILKGSSSGESQYSELHSTNTGELGIVNLVIGNGTGKTGDLTAIDWGTDTYFLKVEIDKIGGTSYVEMGTIQLLSVPYAVYAKSSATAIDAVNLTGDQTVGGGKTFSNTIIGNISGNAGSVTNGVYTSGNQTIDGNKTFTGTTTVLTPVNPTDAVTKAYVDDLKEQIEELQILAGLKIKDTDGNVYGIVTIGTQTWMADNLKATHFNDGTPVPLITLPGDWIGLSTPGYCWYENNEASNKAIYGALYNWYAVSTGKLCPSGWHVPTDAEWTELTDFLGGLTVAGGKLKETGTVHWTDPNTGATNETGFTALPGGNRYNADGLFYHIGTNANWWSSTESSYLEAWLRGAHYDLSSISSGSLSKVWGFSVRCIKD